jgi:hypothetical protein
MKLGFYTTCHPPLYIEKTKCKECKPVHRKKIKKIKIKIKMQRVQACMMIFSFYGLDTLARLGD